MLVLTRKHQEKIRIGDHITITVLKTKGKSVRLGIEAPAEVPVIRGELSFEVKPQGLRVGVVGFGEAGQIHVRHLQSAGAEVVGIVTRRHDIKRDFPIYPS